MLACSATRILEILPLVNRIHVCPPQVPDYDESIIQRAVQTLASKQLGEYAHRQRLEGLAAGGRRMCILRSGVGQPVPLVNLRS